MSFHLPSTNIIHISKLNSSLNTTFKINNIAVSKYIKLFIESYHKQFNVFVFL